MKTFYQQEVERIRQSCYSNKKHIETVVATKHYIDHNWAQEVSLDLLSADRFMSKYHLLRLFKRYYGQTPGQYLIDVRIQKSKERLREGLTVMETCFAVGFESPSSFSTLFRKKTGRSPSAFQKSNFQ